MQYRREQAKVEAANLKSVTTVGNDGWSGKNKKTGGKGNTPGASHFGRGGGA